MLKKNWVSLSLALVFILGAIFMIIFLAGLNDPDFIDIIIYIGVLAGFVGLAAAMILNALGLNKISSLLMLITGAVVSVLVIIGLINAMTQDIPEGGNIISDALREAAINLRRTVYTVPGFVFLFTLGIVPTILGVKGFFGKDKK